MVQAWGNLITALEHIILGHSGAFLWDSWVLCLVYTLKSLLTIGYNSLLTFVGFETFLIKHLPLKSQVDDSERMPPSHHARGWKRRTRELRDRSPHGLSVVVAMVCGRPRITATLCFPWIVWLRVNGGCYMKACLTTWTRDHNLSILEIS